MPRNFDKHYNGLRKGITGHRRRLAVAQKWKCPICGGKLRSGTPINIDHIMPLSKGGSNAITNKQLVHVGCNLHKSNSWDGAAGVARDKYGAAKIAVNPELS